MIFNGMCPLLSTCKEPMSNCHRKYIARCMNNPKYGKKDDNELSTLEMIDSILEDNELKFIRPFSSYDEKIRYAKGLASDKGRIVWNDGSTFHINIVTMSYKWCKYE